MLRATEDSTNIPILIVCAPRHVTALVLILLRPPAWLRVQPCTSRMSSSSSLGQNASWDFHHLLAFTRFLFLEPRKYSGNVSTCLWCKPFFPHSQPRPPSSNWREVFFVAIVESCWKALLDGWRTSKIFSGRSRKGERISGPSCCGILATVASSSHSYPACARGTTRWVWSMWQDAYWPF